RASCGAAAWPCRSRGKLRATPSRSILRNHHSRPLKWSEGSAAVRLADEAAAVAGCMRRPAAGDAPAEDRGAQHGAFEPGAPVDVAPGHAGDLARGIEPGNRLEVPVEHAALEVGLDAAEVLARKRKNLHRVVGRRV